MAKINDLVSLVVQIQGVMNYILVREDGHTLSHNFENFEALPSIITFSGLNSEVLKPIMGLTYFKYMSYIRENNEKLLIFPLGKYFLGILQDPEAYTPDIVDTIEKIIESITQKRQRDE